MSTQTEDRTSTRPQDGGKNARRQESGRDGRGRGGRGRGRDDPGRGRGRGISGSPPKRNRGHKSHHTPNKTISNPERGNGYKSHHNHTPNKSRSSPSGKLSRLPQVSTVPLHIETVAFLTMHAQCEAFKYKVHRPGCNCSKMEGIRARPISNHHRHNNNKTQGINLTELMDNLNLSTEQNGGDNKSPTDLFDNLIVVADTKGKNTPAVFACTKTGRAQYALDPRGCERKLQLELFGKEDTDKLDNPEHGLPSFKVSCAVCLLKDDPNGFVCMAAASTEELTTGVIQKAQGIADRKRNEPGGLHHDHAHFVIALPVKSLQNLRMKPKSKENKQAILLQMQEAGVQVEDDCINDDNNCEKAKVKMGHHLVTLLRHMERKKVNNNKAMTHWMVIGYIDGPTVWELDLPGGKRHLGESTLDCAVRETEEECSVLVDPEGISADKGLHDGECNIFYMLEPPFQQI